jgi:hypothetical protein
MHFSILRIHPSTCHLHVHATLGNCSHETGNNGWSLPTHTCSKERTVYKRLDALCETIDKAHHLVPIHTAQLIARKHRDYIDYQQHSRTPLRAYDIAALMDRARLPSYIAWMQRTCHRAPPRQASVQSTVPSSNSFQYSLAALACSSPTSPPLSLSTSLSGMTTHSPSYTSHSSGPSSSTTSRSSGSSDTLGITSPVHRCHL